MSSISRNRLLGSSAGLALLLSGAFFAASPAAAQQVADNSDLETVVVSGTAFNTDIAPAKSSLEAMEPQTIINQSYIQDSTASTADYTTVLAIAPSMTGQDINGPGLSDGNVKNTLRGLPDGDFVMQYDGIPFGDTNGPSHHSKSYFPGVTIGSIDVDRGPGNAGNLGAATYGGTVKLFSEVLSPDQRLAGTETYGSWDTDMSNLNYQSGDFGVAGMNSRALANFEYTGSSGYLTGQNTNRQNLLVKTQTDLGANWTVTFFANYNGLFQHVNDNNGATASQINTYGESYALETATSTKLGTYQDFSSQNKKTDMDYVRLEGDIGSVHLDDQIYTYAYVNKTISSTNIMQTRADITNGVTEGLGTIVNGVKFANDVPGYTKLNAYRVWGDVLRFSDDFNLGWLTGQVRAGIWLESSATQRQRKDFDLTQCLANGCNPWHNSTYSNSSLVSKTKSAFNQDGYYEYIQHSNWNQYEPFVEVDLKPIDGLTLTPGFKYINWDRSVSAPLEQKTVPVVPFYGSFTTTRALPFFEANYKLQTSWSVYTQYAQGIYVPDIGVYNTGAGPLNVFPKAETTTNYQVGSVYYADNFTVDGDLYYINIDNAYSAVPCNSAPFFGSSGETCELNNGKATYQGIEGEGTYAFTGANLFDMPLDGLSVFASGSYNSDKIDTTHLYLLQAPLWTEANGLVYKYDNLKLSMIDKVVGQQYSDAANTQFYKLTTYNNMDVKAGLTFGNFELDAGIYNILNQRNLLAVTINDKGPIGGTNVYNVTARGSSLDQYYFAPPLNFQVNLKATF